MIISLMALVGSGEYLPVMDTVDRYLLANCGATGRIPRVVCLPTAAGEEGEASVSRWMHMGEDHFRQLGAEVKALHVTHREEADDPVNAEAVESADLVYCSGGNPHYLFETLNGSRLWQSAEKASERGAVYAGCSAGAMIMGEHMPDFRSLGIRKKAAFGVLRGATIFPHFDQMMRWRVMLMPMLQSRVSPGDYALGIDEDTALVGTPGASWQVMGRGSVYVITKKEVISYEAGQSPILPS
jgi:cyanophycinase